MSDPYIGEIRMFAGTFAPLNWAFCNGQLMPIANNDALYALLGTVYGGDGIVTFALPDLRGRLPLHVGQGPGLSPRQIGQVGGSEEETLIIPQLPSHNHGVLAESGAGGKSSPKDVAPATASSALYSPVGSVTGPMSGQALGAAGGSQPHENMMPYLCVNFIISLFGIYPTQS
ncbi:hypothetical protein LL06_23295 [Hoeflea sp. BAL378]|uniref:phage tail protein n=1 Tax=Hoeflea sp. BAL378 TaxID=1547437 RepID=UPI00051391C4|nr:tail fiber protein [Hoeflea sp. BAL378]KGF67334.1 hypothetical protein LL06_23295 [Hoeflea sp. BAL378]